jgi:Peptidase MA superfamily
LAALSVAATVSAAEKSRAVTPPSASGSPCARCAQAQSAGWYFAESGSFRVWCRSGCRDVGKFAQQCERLRSELQSKWLGHDVPGDWSPKCDVVVHASAASYLQAVGPGAERTAGSSLVKVEAGRVISRRLDLRADRGDALSAAPHELTHIVLADRFADRPLPRWADEGMATLADSPSKRGEHRRDLLAAVARRTELRLADLLSMEGYPKPASWATFYGQSASLVEFLLERGEPEELVRCVGRAQDVGYDAALREVYGIAGVAALERQWRAHATRPPIEPATLVRDVAPKNGGG